MNNLSRYRRIVRKINLLAKKFETLRDSDFPAKTALLKMRVNTGESLDSLLPDAYALVREVAKRTVGLWAFDVQLMGAIAAHEGQIVEMKTGEGKTLAIIFPAFLNALHEKGVHVVTANDYLAERDANWAAKVYKLLGVSVGSIVSTTSDFDRQVSYSADITYITSNELGFDFLKDNMLYDLSNKRQRTLHYAIIDEADSVLLDEAQTPLVIANNQNLEDKDKEFFGKISGCVAALKRNVDFKVDRKSQTISLTIEGINKLEKVLGVENLYGENDEDYLYFVERLLKAHYLFKKDKDYVVDEGEVVIVDEFTGRLMQSHRYFQGIHQAIEAKEGVEVKAETQTLASITFQNFFKRYLKICGLTGTAQTAEREFRLIYKKEVFIVPTNMPVIRKDLPDRFFLTWNDKLNYLAWTTQEYFFKNRAELIGTRSVAKSHQVQMALISENIPCNVLNAKHTRREAEVVAMAGKSQMVTVATNMAGRGTDIMLDEQVAKEGGLVIFGTERHNARRIDNQLIGRSGRQGDPGQAQFLISGEDELIKTYFKEAYEKEIKKKRNYEQGAESKKLEKLLLKAQKRMESVFFDQRILNYEFDKVFDKQRESFYRQRMRVLEDRDLKNETLMLIKQEIYQTILKHKAKETKVLSREEMELIKNEIAGWIKNGWLKVDFEQKNQYLFIDALNLFYEAVANYYQDFENYISPERMRETEKIVTLKVLDLLWLEQIERVEDIQDASLIGSISRADFFEEYEIEMAEVYKKMLFSAPRIICLTLFRTMNRMWQTEEKIQAAG